MLRLAMLRNKAKAKKGHDDDALLIKVFVLFSSPCVHSFCYCICLVVCHFVFYRSVFFTFDLRNCSDSCSQQSLRFSLMISALLDLDFVLLGLKVNTGLNPANPPATLRPNLLNVLLCGSGQYQKWATFSWCGAQWYKNSHSFLMLILQCSM